MVRYILIAQIALALVLPNASYAQSGRKNPKPPKVDLEPKNAGVQPVPLPSPEPGRDPKTAEEIILEDASRPHFDRGDMIRKRQRALGLERGGSTEVKDDFSGMD